MMKALMVGLIEVAALLLGVWWLVERIRTFWKGGAK